MTVFFVNRNENENEFVLGDTKKPTLWGCTIYFHLVRLKWWHLRLSFKLQLRRRLQAHRAKLVRCGRGKGGLV